MIVTHIISVLPLLFSSMSTSLPVDNTNAEIPLSLGSKIIIVCVIREGSAFYAAMHGYKTLLTKILILSCSQVKKYRYNVWSFVSSQGSWMHICLHKKQTYLPIKAENKITMPVTATTVLLLLLHFHLSKENNEYLFHENHDLALYFPFSRIRVNRGHIVMCFIRTWPLQISSGSQSLGEKEHKRKDCKCQQH